MKVGGTKYQYPKVFWQFSFESCLIAAPLLDQMEKYLNKLKFGSEDVYDDDVVEAILNGSANTLLIPYMKKEEDEAN